MTFARLLQAGLSAVAVIVPASRRRPWREQWDAELAHYDRWLATDGRAPFARNARLAARASGAIPHAFTIRLLSWRPRMIGHDLKFAWRMFVRRPAFTAISILILALGIGANATMFSWLESIVLDPLSGVPGQQQLVALYGTSGSRDNLSFSYPNFADIRAAKPTGLSDVTAFRIVAMTLNTGAAPTRAFGELVSGNFFDVLGVKPVLGRGFSPEEGDTAGRGSAVVLISDGLWQRLFGGDPSAIGRTLKINTTAFTVIGILPREFHGSAAGLSLDVYVPMGMQTAVMPGDRLAARGNSWLEVYGRLAPDATLDQVRGSLATVADRLARAYPGANEGRGIAAVPLSQADASGMLRPVLATLMAFVGLVLIITCANIAGLLLARAASRQRELAVRLAVGASRAHLVRQLAVEALLLAIAGGGAGLLMARWTSRALGWFVPPSPYPIAFDSQVNPRVMAFAALATLVTAIATGLLPGLRASRPNVSATLKDAAAANIGSNGRMRHALVVGQVALSTLLLVCAALFVRSLGNAKSIDTGYSARTGLLASIDLQAGGYDAARGGAFIERVIERTNAVPGVVSASVASAIPLDISGGSDQGFSVDGYSAQAGEEMTAYYNRVGVGYFETMGVPVVEGRPFTNADEAGAPRVAVINQTMARKYFAGRSAIGGHLRFGSGQVTVVGVARDGKYQSLTETPKNFMYLPVLQSYWPSLVLHVRTSGEPLAVLPAVTRELHALDSGLPLFDVRTIEEHRRISVFVPKLAGTLLGLFGGLSLVLAAVGLYGVMAFTVAQRTREIGVRIALGATRGEVIGLVLRQGFGVAAVGIAFGLVLSALAGRLLRSQLIATSSADPLSFGLTALLLFVVAAAACTVPATRAARLEPLSALRRD